MFISEMAGDPPGGSGHSGSPGASGSGVKKCPRQTPFQTSHAVNFGLRVSLLGLDGKVDTVVCRFCSTFGRDESMEGRKRKRTDHFQSWTAPFRPECYRKHHKAQHPNEWAEYSKLSYALKVDYFEKNKGESVRGYFESEGGQGLVIRISAPIVEDVICSLFFRTGCDDDEDENAIVSRQAALELFSPDEENEGFYVVKVPNALRFNLGLDNISAGLSFRQVEVIMQQYRVRLGNGKLKGMSRNLIGNYVRVCLGANLQIIGGLLTSRKQWAFSVAGDGSTCHGVSFFDIRVRVATKGVLMNLHLLVVPFFERHTAKNIVKLLCIIFDSIAPGWRKKLLSVGTDGENTMTGRHGGVATLLEREASHKILRIWCPPHQVDLEIQGCTKAVDGGQFYKSTHDLSVHLRKQQNLATEMKSKCPKDTTRWLAFGNMCSYFVTKRRALMKHFEERTDWAPSPKWWLLVAGLQPVFLAISFSFKALEKKELVISQQTSELNALVETLVDAAHLRDIDEDDSYEDMGLTSYFCLDEHPNWWVSLADMRCHVEDCGSWTQAEFGLLSEDEIRLVLVEISTFCIQLVDGIADVKAERDSDNNAGEDAPPVMPEQLAVLRTGVFIKNVLDPFREHLEDHWTPEEIDLVEEDHKALVTAYKTEPAFKQRLEKHNMKTMFNASWDDCNGRFLHLRDFSAGLATAFHNTTSVESDFSILKWEFSGNRKSLSNLSLGGIFQTKQREALSKLLP